VHNDITLLFYAYQCCFKFTKIKHYIIFYTSSCTKFPGTIYNHFNNSIWLYILPFPKPNIAKVINNIVLIFCLCCNVLLIKVIFNLLPVKMLSVFRSMECKGGGFSLHLIFKRALRIYIIQ
jgi:hypothetical protein